MHLAEYYSGGPPLGLRHPFSEGRQDEEHSEVNGRRAQLGLVQAEGSIPDRGADLDQEGLGHLVFRQGGCDVHGSEDSPKVQKPKKMMMKSMVLARA